MPSTDRQKFCKNSEIVFRTAQGMQIYQKPDVDICNDFNTFFFHGEQKKLKRILKLRFEKTLLSNLNYLFWYTFDILCTEISIFKAQRD